ncbi:hypothetical protein GGX14DRAFT_393777 [Mycena pura]|uniref:Uncharacterized protein n=1 Tax=Mycena pura TaxID=153505 RepID=A0AAD6VGL2_9AGAR|nr:hypothetical protein GGX14DRAFT_393777 [Mycena pura]
MQHYKIRLVHNSTSNTIAAACGCDVRVGVEWMKRMCALPMRKPSPGALCVDVVVTRLCEPFKPVRGHRRCREDKHRMHCHDAAQYALQRGHQKTPSCEYTHPASLDQPSVPPSPTRASAPSPCRPNRVLTTPLADVLYSADDAYDAYDECAAPRAAVARVTRRVHVVRRRSRIASKPARYVHYTRVKRHVAGVARHGRVWRVRGGWAGWMAVRSMQLVLGTYSGWHAMCGCCAACTVCARRLQRAACDVGRTASGKRRAASAERQAAELVRLEGGVSGSCVPWAWGRQIATTDEGVAGVSLMAVVGARGRAGYSLVVNGGVGRGMQVARLGDRDENFVQSSRVKAIRKDNLAKSAAPHGGEGPACIEACPYGYMT